MAIPPLSRFEIRSDKGRYRHLSTFPLTIHNKMSGDEWFTKDIKTFPATELKPFAEPVTSDQMQEGRVYFALQYLDDDLFVPVLRPMLFLGYLDAERPSLRYFQDFDSFRAGVRFSNRSEEDSAHFEVYGPDEGKHIFEYARALDCLMRCTLNRSEAADIDHRILQGAERSRSSEPT